MLKDSVGVTPHGVFDIISSPIPNRNSKMYHIIAQLLMAQLAALLWYAIFGVQFIHYKMGVSILFICKSLYTTESFFHDVMISYHHIIASSYHRTIIESSSTKKM